MNISSDAPLSAKSRTNVRPERRPLSRLLATLGALLLVLGLFGATRAQAQPMPGAEPAGPRGITIGAPGTQATTPIGVPDTYNFGSSDPDGLGSRIAMTIRRCLQIAGYFDVYGPDRYFFSTSDEGMLASSIKFDNWVAVGAAGLIKTSFQVAGAQVALDFRLYDINSREQVDIGWSQKAVPLSQAMREVYSFVNLVIKYYSGDEGLFGSRIAYVRRIRNGVKEIYTTTMDGTGTSSVTSNDNLNLLPAFGPGGDVMYTSYTSGDPDLYVGDDNDRTLSSRSGLDMGAAMNPSGSEIAITLTKDGNSEIYILDSSGGILRRCTDNQDEDVSPAWSPDGSQIAFVSDRGGNPQIYVMGSDCSGQRRVTFQGNYNTTPDWSPLGDVIAFTGRDERARFDIFTVEPGSGFITRLTQDQGDNREPSWAPNGRYLVFTSNRGGSGESLWVMTSDGNYQFNITPDEGGFETPSWER